MNFSYWLIKTNEYTNDKTYAIGKYGPRMYIQGKEEDIITIVNLLNKNKEE